MRFTGKITTWHDDRGFGFITPDEGGQEIFVHISQLPRGRRPAVGQALGFEVALNADGKKKAVGVYVHVGQLPQDSPKRRADSRPPETRLGLYPSIVLCLVLCAVSFFVYTYWTGGFAPKASMSTLFQCDGRRHCSQMTSCKEAKYFLNNCPGILMDGDSDGIPCEQDLCRGFLDGLLR